MRKSLRWLASAAIAGAIAIQFVRPARTNPVTDPGRALAARIPVTPRAAAVLDRSCRDCHSNGTRWPLYSNVAPISWFVIDHVNHGRRHLNFSDWSRYSPDEAERLLKNTCAFARKKSMPLASYTLVHRQARLTDADVDALCEWTSGALRVARRE